MRRFVSEVPKDEALNRQLRADILRHAAGSAEARRAETDAKLESGE